MPEAIFVPNFLSLELPNAELPNLELPDAEVSNVEAPMRLPTPLCATSEQFAALKGHGFSRAVNRTK
jgi:hypothetical protein